MRALASLGPRLESRPERSEIPSELSVGAASVLWAVALAARPIGVGELAAQLRMAGPRASRLLGDLEAHGLVERRRDSGDRRRVSVTLAAEGRRLADMWRSAQIRRLRSLLDALGGRDAEHLVRIFERAAARLHGAAGSGARVRGSSSPRERLA